MRTCWALVRVCAATVVLAAALAVSDAPRATAAAPTRAAANPLIPALQIDGRGFGHGVGMAQDGALTMGKSGANVKQILGQFYPGTSLGKASGDVRVPVFSGSNVQLSFPDGGDIRGYAANGGAPSSIHVAPGTTVVVYRDGDTTKVQTANDSPPPAPASTTTSSSTTTTSPATTTTTPSPTTTTTLLPHDTPKKSPNAATSTPTITSPPSTTTTTAPPAAAAQGFSGDVTATPANSGRVGVVPRNRRYRGVIDIAPVAGSLRFVNQVNVETYLRGMGEVRNPSWPAASLQAQAIAARTYALRAMAFGGELCDSQKCQVYIGSDAEYAAMDKAVAATSGEVLTFGKSLASAVYSANGGAHSADQQEGFGMASDSYPYLRAAPYSTDNPDPWSVTVALSDVAHRLGYAGAVTDATVTGRGPSGRALSIELSGNQGDKSVTGLEFAKSLGLHSTLFSLRPVMAAKVADVTGGSVLQAPPEDAPEIADETVVTAPPPPPSPAAIPVRVQAPLNSPPGVGFFSLVAAALWGAVVVSAFRWRRRARSAITRQLS